MNNSDFCHLHVHTEYSQLDGFGSPKNYISRAKELGFKYLAITDHGNIDGVLSFQKESEKQGIESVIGCEAYIVPDAKTKQKGDKRNHIILLVKNQVGWRNICQLLTYANLEGFYYKPRIDYQFLLDHCEGLVVLTGCAASFLIQDTELIFFKQLYKKLKDDLYLEIMPHNISAQKNINEICKRVKSIFPKIKMIATADCHYINEDDFEAQQVLLAIQTRVKWDDPKRWSFKSSHLKSIDEIFEAFKIQRQFRKREYKEAIYNTIEVAEKCSNFRIERRKVELPKIIKNKDSKQYLKRLCFNGFKRIFGKKILLDKVYYERFVEELHLICSKDYAEYFLIVRDLVEWCRKNNIMTGDRGSVGGCLIAYLLGITSTDPIKFDLLFSRFISESRIDLPDVDIDFEDFKRVKVRQYLAETYGENNIAGVSTFLRMKGKAAIRDVARVFDIPYKEVDRFAKVIETAEKSNEESMIEQAVEKTNEGEEFCKKYPKEVQIAMKLENTIRSSGQHAAAVLVSLDDLSKSDRCNLAIRSKKIVVNWDMSDCEYMGLMKLDILGLNALSVLNETKRLVKENYNTNIIFEKIDLNDKEVLNEFAYGNTIGCHQFHSYGIANLCKELEIDSFNMLVHTNALYRPGPLRSGMVDEFVKRKNGKKWKSISKEIEIITKDTLGIIIYQEQVMMIAYKVASMPWKEADKIRKVIGKSKGSKELHKFKRAFVSGCIKNKTLDEKQAEGLWNDLETFGGYGFNKSHSVEYSRIGYWGQYLKTYYPTEFICASLTYSSEDKKDNLVQEAYRLSLSVILPKIGISHATKWIAKGKKLYAPFIEIKGVGEKSAEKVSKTKIKAKKQNSQKVQKRFFSIKNSNIKKQNNKITKIDKILEDIGAFNNSNEISSTASQYFSFKVTDDPKILYPNFHKIIDNNYSSSDFEDILQGKLYFPSIVIKKSEKDKKLLIDDNLLSCRNCELINECTNPVMPSIGNYNVAIIGEAPGKKENEKSKGFVGGAGKDILWPELKKYKLYRKMFFISNCVKCWPSTTKTPSKQQIKKCSKWIDKEIEILSPKLILAFGNTSLYYFKNQSSGIINMNGKTEWNEKAKAWICYCVHPASVLHNQDNREYFENGIKNFAEKVKLFRK